MDVLGTWVRLTDQPDHHGAANSMDQIVKKCMSLPLAFLVVLISTALLVHIHYWWFSMGMTKVQVDMRSAPEDFPVVCMIWYNGKRVPIMKSKGRIDFDVAHFYKSVNDWLSDYSCLLPSNGTDELRNYGEEVDGWLVVKDIGAHKQFINVADGRSAHGLVTHAAWYAADRRGYKPQYYARYAVPIAVARSFLISMVLCLFVRYVGDRKRVQSP